VQDALLEEAFPPPEGEEQEKFHALAHDLNGSKV